MKQHIYTRDIILILAASFFYMMSPMLVNPLIAGFSLRVGATNWLAGLIAGAMNITSLLLRPAAGNLVDRYSKFTLSSIGGGLMLMAAIGYLLTTGWFELILIRVINGVGYVLCTVCMATWMANLLPRKNMGSGMGMYGLMNALCMAISPALGIYLYQHVGYRAAFIACAIASVLMISLVQLVSDHGQPLAKTEVKVVKHRPRIIQPQVLPVSLIIMLFALPYFATQAYIVTYVADLHTPVAVGSFFPIYAVILLGLRLALKNLFDSVAFGRFLYASLGFTMVGLLALTHLVNNWWMLLAAFGLAAGYGLMFSICQATALLIAPMSQQGLANSTFYIGMDLGMALGPIIGGLIRSALPVMWFYPVMMITLPLIWAVYFFNRRTLDHVLS